MGSSTTAPSGPPVNPGGSPPPPPPDVRKQAFDFAADATKQLITVATGVVTATAIFSRDLDSPSRYLALCSWIVLTVSVLFGISALLNMTGNLHNAIATSSPPSLSSGIQFFSKLQLWTFLLGIVLVMFFGFVAARVRTTSDSKPTTINCVVPNMPAPVIVQVPAAPAGGNRRSDKAGKKK
jgi:hypothetical protein